MNKVFFSIGTNLANREQNLSNAIEQIIGQVGPLINVSSIYETKAWGVENQPDFLNQVLLVDTALSPRETLKTILQIEDDLGRVRTRKWFTRLIDIDILFYEDFIIQEKDLIIPHPYIQERNFVLAPLVEIAPNFYHPVLKKSIADLYIDCKDPLPVIMNDEV